MKKFTYNVCDCGKPMEVTHVHLSQTTVVASLLLERALNDFKRSNKGVIVDNVTHGSAGFSISGHKIEERW